jgi:hypothetical protein
MANKTGVKKGDKVLFRSRFYSRGYEAIFLKGAYKKDTKIFMIDLKPLNSKSIHCSFIGRKGDFSMEKMNE